MSNPDEIRESYKVLELPFGAPATAVRRAFRQLAKAYHPDRYSAGSTMEQHAQEKMKTINRAYEVLAKAKAPGAADPMGPPRQRSAAVEPEDLERARQAREAARIRVERENRQAAQERPAQDRPRRGRLQPRAPRRRQMAAAVAVLGALFFAAAYPLSLALARRRPPPAASAPSSPPAQSPPLPSPPSEVERGDPTALAPSAPRPIARPPNPRSIGPDPIPTDAARVWDHPTPPPDFGPARSEMPEERAAAAEIRGNFSVGSSRAEVLAAQGNPDARSESVFQYGSSVVYFKNGVVASWVQGQPALRARLPFPAAASRLGAFTVGSRKDEVVAIQGRPSATSRDIFQYGSSVVYFEADRVLGWAEGSTPLRARRPSDLLAISVGAFALGSRRDEVIAVQGRPDAITPDSFHYGSSVVRFAQDRVVSWTDGDPPLKLRRRGPATVPIARPPGH